MCDADLCVIMRCMHCFILHVWMHYTDVICDYDVDAPRYDVWFNAIVKWTKMPNEH